MLVSEIIDRTFHDWLYPAGINRPPFGLLEADIGAGDTSLAVSDRITVPQDSVLEIDDELILVQSSQSGTVTANERGYLGSTAAAHVTGDKVFLDPIFSRWMVFKILCDLVRDLPGQGVYARTVDTSSLTWTRGVVALPAGAVRLLKLSVRRPLSYEDYRRLRPEKGEYEPLYEFDPPKVRLIRGGYETAEMIVTYSKDFTVPTSVDDDITTDCDVPASLASHFPVGIAGSILRSRELPRVLVEEVKRLLAAQGVQIGAALNVGAALFHMYEQYVDVEYRRLRMLDPVSFERTY